MNLSVIVATLEGCPPALIDDPAGIRRALHEAVAAGGFTLLHSHVHEFEPQGVTGTVVLSESHIAVHSWPEEGVLFLDLATCSGEEATEAAFARICQLIPHERVCRQDVGYRGAAGCRPASMAAAPPPVLRRAG
jgi:S-adenosylmethionine decarboxylase